MYICMFKNWDHYVDIVKTSSFLKKLIYLYLAALGLHCCTWAFSSCGELGLLPIAVRGLLTAEACLVAEHRL